MKFPPVVLLFVGVLSTTASAFSFLSTFTRHAATNSRQPQQNAAAAMSIHYARLSMYDASQSSSAWTVLANTERWISETLASVPGNPYARKEVSYVCETADDSALVVANLYKRLREARELGETHGQRERAASSESSYRPSTLRQTQVIVLPNNDVLSDDFDVFNNLVEAINNARRQARDYVTDVALEKLHNQLDSDDEDSDDDDDEGEWNVSVNCAHLHPKFDTISSSVDDDDDDDDDESEDAEYLAYQQRKMQARRSPYPTLVLEVRSQPPVDFDSPSSSAESKYSGSSTTDAPVQSADIKKLEALFSQSAHMQHPTAKPSPEEKEEAFYQALGNSMEQQISSLAPMTLAQQWLTQNVYDLPPQPALVESNTPHVDAAYEFVFTNLAMMKHNSMTSSDTSIDASVHYLVMPQFLSSAATSAEKFAAQVLNIVQTLPEWRDSVQVTVYHPEHIDPTKRSPMTMFKLEWNKGNQQQQ